jgi:hypothetical protein
MIICAYKLCAYTVQGTFSSAPNSLVKSLERSEGRPIHGQVDNRHARRIQGPLLKYAALQHENISKNTWNTSKSLSNEMDGWMVVRSCRC